MGQVAALAAVTIDNQWLARLDPAAEGFQGQVGPLAGAPHREEPQGQEAQAVLAGVEAAPLFAVELGQGVGAASDDNAAISPRIKQTLGSRGARLA